jgi:hypothetical protein
MAMRITVRKLISAFLTAALVVLSPGLGCYEAAAAILRGKIVSIKAPLNAPTRLGALNTVSPFGPLTVEKSGRLAVGLAPRASLPILPLPAANAPAAGTIQSVPAPALAQVRDTVAELAKPDNGGVLESVYSGSARRSTPDSVAVDGSGLVSAAALSPATPAKSIPALEAEANDSSRSFPDRLAAVSAIAAFADSSAKASLKAIGQAKPDGNAEDYEIKRKALQALAALGELVSLPAVSRAHADEILRQLAADKPQLAVFDYDDTLERNSQPASPETAAALRAAARAGVETMILTARSDRADANKGVSVLESLSTLTPDQKSGLMLGSDLGARLVLFDEKGQARLISAQPAWSKAELVGIKESIAAIRASYGQAPAGKEDELDAYGFSLVLPVGTSADAVRAAAEMLAAELAQRGVKVAGTVGRMAMKESNPPYLVVSKYDKSFGVARMRADHEYFSRMRDVVQKLPGWLQSAGKKFVSILPRRSAPSAATLKIGRASCRERVS